MLRNLSPDFAGYVINNVGLEDIHCRLSLVSLQIAGWLSAENFENSI